MSSNIQSSNKNTNINNIGDNFMRQFRDKNTRQLKNLTSTQFMEVWSHYDHDGKSFFVDDDDDDLRY